MMIRSRQLISLCALMIAGAGIFLTPASISATNAQSQWPLEEASPTAVVVGLVQYDGGKVARCFASEFLEIINYETDIELAGEFKPVDADSEALFDHPFAIMSGEGAFELSEREIDNLRSYLEQGGFLLASAGCSSQTWSRSMGRTINRLFPDVELEELTLDHEVFSTLYDVDELQTSNRSDAAVFGLSLDGRLTIVFSPNGLNDTAAAARGCCCCGGSEVRNAKYINANILVYALLR